MKVGVTAAAPSGVASSSVAAPLHATSKHRSTCLGTTGHARQQRAAGVKVGVTAAAPPGVASSSVAAPLHATSMHRSTCLGTTGHARQQRAAGVKVGVTAAAPPGVASSSVAAPLHATSMHRSTWTTGMLPVKGGGSSHTKRHAQLRGARRPPWHDHGGVRQPRGAKGCRQVLLPHPVGAALRGGAPGARADGVARARRVRRLRRQRLHHRAHLRARGGFPAGFGPRAQMTRFPRKTMQTATDAHPLTGSDPSDSILSHACVA